MTAIDDRPHDDVLAGAIAMLSGPELLPACREQLTDVEDDRRRRWTRLNLVESAYHPGRYVRVVVAMMTEEDVPQRRLWPEAHLIYLHTPVRTPMSRRGNVLRIGRESFEAYCFPEDRRLRGLRKFAGSNDAAEQWARWNERAGGSGRIIPETLQRVLLRYVPEDRWVVRLRAEFEDHATGQRTKRRIAVRCTSPAAAADILRRQDQVRRELHEREATIRVPEVKGADVELGLIAVEWDRGDSLLTALREGGAVPVLLGAADALRLFHRLRLGDLPTLGDVDVRASATAAAEQVGLACPSLAERLRSTSDGVGRALADAAPRIRSTLHNDFHPMQVNVKRGRFTFLDLDRMALGDPLVDVANFAVQLRMLADRPEYGVDAATAHEWATGFLDEWSQKSNAPWDTDRFRAYAATSALTLALGMMRHLRPGWRPLAERCTEVAERLLGATTARVLTS
ncbi:MAG: hypothetical protein AABZ12_02410 [Planctomycetota bacterium]